MTSERGRQIERVYHAALAADEGARDAVLDEMCAGDDGLRREVVSLLEHEGDAQSFLSEPAIDLLARAVATETYSLKAGTEPVDQARFIPGAMLAGRYRIVSLLGRGGMGDVYRAEDLKLGQLVALKFLPKAVAHRADRLTRLHNEVRVARQVSHPNVCRVYDIGEADGQHFLSMEYVDGEDLASLLRRIGRLPPDKALELARQLCAGLAASHDRGVLHRDLKPANVLIDGRGRARIADFGIAGLADERQDLLVLKGTPPYMAPEQFTGHETSTRTDIYALGLVLYEMFTGKPAFPIVAPDLLGRVTDRGPLVSPSRSIPDFDPAVERAILWCLERDPALRPPSVLAMAASLPGGNPLAAALAAGETPSPDMVAAAGDVGSLSPSRGLACLALIVAGLVAIVWMSPQTSLPGLVTMDTRPEVLAEFARAIARNLGYTDRPADEAYGYERDPDYLRYIEAHNPSATRWQILRTGQPAALSFWYRQSPHQLISAASEIEAIGVVTRQEPPSTVPGMVSVLIDQAGRLISLTAAPSRIDESAAGDRQPDWTALFVEAGLSIAEFSPARPTRIPSVYADTRAAWEGVYPDRPEIPIRVEAAAARGRPTYFEIVAPWTPPQHLEPARFPTDGDRVRYVIGVSLGLLVSAFAVLLVRRNLRLGRGDRRGAFRLCLYLGSMGLLFGTLRAHHVGDLAAERELSVMLTAWATYGALVMWLFYIALEPYVRAVWPEMMIGWSRLLAGRWRDPLVGRDILIGVVAGIVLATVIHVERLGPAWFGLPPSLSASGSGQLLLGGRHAVSELAAWQVRAVTIGLVFLLALILFNRLLRNRRLAAVATALVLTMTPALPAVAGGNAVFTVLVVAVWAMGTVVVLVRCGLLAMIVSQFVFQITSLVPITFDLSAPYISLLYLCFGTVVALAAYGFHTAMGGRPVFGAGFLPDEPARP